MPANKELERTRSTQTAWGPRRSIQCSTDLEADQSAVRGGGKTMHRNRGLSILVILMAVWTGDPAVQASGAQVSEPTNVSMVQLLATPERFHGKRIRVVGWRVWALEESVVYLHSEDAEYRTNRIWLELETKEAKRFAGAPNHGPCVIEGEFDASKGNNFALVPTSIKNITRIERVRSRTELNVGPRPRHTPR